ncbi:hypothetical protein GCM10020358_35450 [Amorphoplanes nipponensis]
MAGIAGARSITRPAPAGAADGTSLAVSAAAGGDLAVLTMAGAAGGQPPPVALTEDLLADAYARL